jgi:tRNA (guanine37-N1)-methyltransferase
MCPQGRVFTQRVARELANHPALAFVCGRYEGFDERIRAHVDEELSLGDFVLTGGEPAAMAVIDAVVRLLPGVLGNAESAVSESHGEDETLEYPQYTRPAVFRDVPVPATLTSGDHARVARWRRWHALRRTRERRPDLFAKLSLTPKELAWLDGDEP